MELFVKCSALIAVSLCFVLFNVLALSVSEHGICNLRQFQCNDKECIPVSWVCDGENDCSDSSDETVAQCPYVNRTCGKYGIKCGNGRCIPIQWQCDGEKDCSNGSDEDGCELKICNPDEFKCKTFVGHCIPLTWVCDDDPDCADRSDEQGCNVTCTSNEFTCENENRCISLRWRCDGDVDCAGGEDEQDCHKRPSSLCTLKEYDCKDNITCISRMWMCDGDKDCPDGSDESPTLCGNITCRPDQFQCKDLSCIAKKLHCSGHPDCPDGSDEVGCVEECDPKTHFDCGGANCISLADLCNGQQDCPEGEDEPKDRCGVNECLQNNGGCSQNCVDIPVGYYCDCNTGYKLVDNKTCEDIDECEIPGSCSQICTNENATYHCECLEGYTKDHLDKTRCKATEGNASLLIAYGTSIFLTSLDKPEVTAIVDDSYGTITALDYDFRTGMIFWSDASNLKIFKTCVDNGNEHSVVRNNEAVDDLAIDWIYKHIYWVGRNTIELANFNGEMRKVLIKNELSEPRAIALTPNEGWMFWTDWGDVPKIERAGMDGSHRQTIVTRSIKWPNGLTLDLVMKRVYWTDGRLKTISSCDYNGKKRRDILQSNEHLKHPFGIATFEDWVYWSDWQNRDVFKIDKLGNNVETFDVPKMIKLPMGIQVYHPLKQPEGSNYCEKDNVQCSHLCLPAPQINSRSLHTSCACPEDLRMLSDGVTCVQDN